MSETTLAHRVVPALTRDMLCLADRGLLGFDLWRAAAATGAELLWRASATFTLPVLERFPMACTAANCGGIPSAPARDRTAIPVRVIEYTLPGVPNAEPRYRVVTSLLEPARAPADELAALYAHRWEMETAFDELKTHLKGTSRVLRSKTPALVEQETWGFLLAHFALRALMHGAALGVLPRARDPDTLSFTHTLRVARRTLPHVGAIPPSGHRAAPPRPAGRAGRAPQRNRELEPGPRGPARRQAEDE